MTIGDLVPADRTPRKRAADAVRASVVAVPQQATSDAASVSHADESTVQRMVAVLKGMDPSQAHRVEELRAQIAAGSYTADADALAEAFIMRDDKR